MRRIHCIIETLDPVSILIPSYMKHAGVHGLYIDIWFIDRIITVHADESLKDIENALITIITKRGFYIYRYSWIGETFHVNVKRELWMTSVQVILSRTCSQNTTCYWVHVDERVYKYLSDKTRASHDHDELEIFDLYTWAFYMNSHMECYIDWPACKLRNKLCSDYDRMRDVIQKFITKYNSDILAIEYKFQRMLINQVSHLINRRALRKKYDIIWQSQTLYMIIHKQHTDIVTALCHIFNMYGYGNTYLVPYYPYLSWDLNQEMISNAFGGYNMNINPSDIILYQHACETRYAKIIITPSHLLNKLVLPIYLPQ